MKKLLPVIILLLAAANLMGQSCTYTLQSNYIPIPATQTEYSIGITTNNSDCSWSIMQFCPWVNVLTNVGSGSGFIELQLEENTSSSSRSCNIIVNYPDGSQVVTISQLGTGCNIYAVTPQSGYVSYFETSYIFNVIANPGCNWTALESCPWVTLSTTSGQGQDYITAQFSTNQGAERTCTITVQDQQFILTQGPFGNECTYTLPGNNTGTAQPDDYNYNLTVTTATNCSWTVTEDCDWLELLNSSGTGSGAATLSFGQNFNATGRMCILTVAGQPFIFTQLGQGNPSAVKQTPLENLSLFPNPGKGLLNLTYNLLNEENTSIQVYNMLGQNVYSQNTGRQSGQVSNQIALPNATPGIYLLQLNVGSSFVTQRFVVE